MAAMIPLTAQPRNTALTPRALRREQKVPGVIYGRNRATQSVQFDYGALARVVRQAGTSHLVSLILEGEKPQLTLIREIQRDPLTGRILHVDLYAIEAGQTIRSSVPLVQRGKSEAVAMGGMVVQDLDELEIECLPEDMPEVIEINLEKLATMHSRITVADLAISPKVTVLTPASSVVAHVMTQRIREEAEVKPAAEAAPMAETAREESKTGQ